ncbi:hypothetical protein K3N28_09270 [Glycomyces sp. TRM65418]|uniref:hypothetical protein n=1 Tax=Glycomyces sp. TRM65418 TaxID=2867006 RepID=UPI001CE5EA7F|nr:hypothetical protein [Glycomyces sp. TRM65418]MCC3763260.1 hypothetical protein [Glycomyces sp. TRM65418]QZD57261.1 hypothetical protein K3N28_09210 [Glycomyces sp. TRM65418]
MSAPAGFAYTERADGTVRTVHRGRAAATLRGARAAKFLDEAAHGDPQQACARWTGAYKFGNERTARD